MLKRIGSLQQKILILGITGIGLAFSSSPTSSFGLLKVASQEWKRVNQQSLKRSLQALCRSKLLIEKRHRNGTITLELTEAGKRQVKYLSIFGKGVKIKKPKKSEPRSGDTCIFFLRKKIRAARKRSFLAIGAMKCLSKIRAYLIGIFSLNQDTHHV